MLLFRPCAAVRAGPLLRTTSRMLVVSPRRSARPVAVATEAAVPVFDERLVSEDPELVKRSLLRRKAGDALIASVDRIGELTAERASAVSEGNTARMEKKTLSQKIGGHMKAGEQDEAAALKVEVAKLNEVAGASNPAPAPEHNHEPEPEPKPSAEPQPALCAGAGGRRLGRQGGRAGGTARLALQLAAQPARSAHAGGRRRGQQRRGEPAGGAAPAADEPTRLLRLSPTLILMLSPAFTLAILAHGTPLTDLPPRTPLPPGHTGSCVPASAPACR